MFVTKILTIKKTKRRPIIAPAIAVRLLKKPSRTSPELESKELNKIKLSSKLSEKKHLIANKVHGPTETKRKIRAENSFTKKIPAHSFCSFHVEIIQTLLYIPKSLNT